MANSSAEMADHASNNKNSETDEESTPSMQESSNFHSDVDSGRSRASRKRAKLSTETSYSIEQDDASRPSEISVPSRIRVQIRDSTLNKNPPGDAILVPTDPQTTFQSLNVKPWLVASLSSMAIKQPTGIQKGCIPEILKGRDCIGGSRTGSGKTVAFAVPILQKWAEDPFGIFAVILTPTRSSIMHDMKAESDLLTCLSVENWHCRYTNNSKPSRHPNHLKQY